MNNQIKITLFLSWMGFFCAMPTHSAAQDAPPPLPRFPDGDVAYSVQVTDSAPPASAATGSPQAGNSPPKNPIRLTSARITRIGHRVRYQFTWRGGAASESWADTKAGLDFSQDVPTKTVFLNVLNLGPGSFLGGLGPANAIFNSVGPGNLIGKETQNGKNCFHYKWQFDIPPMPIKYEAWVEEKTGVLIALDDNFVHNTFTFDPAPPTGPLVMPAPFQAKMDRYLEKTMPITRPGPSP